MYSLLLLSGCALYVITRHVLLPIFLFFKDTKGLRRYPNYSFLSGVSDLPICLLSASGSRSKQLVQAHKSKNAPILRTGPNSLSFAHPDAINDIYGHKTTCSKDIKYSLTSNEHPHLFDVIDKTKHAEKRKRLSAAFAIKHLEQWEYKVARSTERLVNALDFYSVPLNHKDSTANKKPVPVDVNYWVNLFTIEAINYIALSSDLSLLIQGNGDVVAERKDGSTYRANYRQAQDSTAYALSHFVWDYNYFRSLVRLSRMFPGWRKIWKESEAWNDIIYHQANVRLERYRKGEELDDFFAALMDDKYGSPYNLELGEIVNEVRTQEVLQFSSQRNAC